MEYDFIKVAMDNGMGLAAFGVLVYFGIQASKFAKTFAENHMVHLQAAIEEGFRSLGGKVDRLSDELKADRLKGDE